jgi:2-polyprenyl-6-methoxyphenol hydroxylase-like FAD-dependent oxidoreductase
VRVADYDLITIGGGLGGSSLGYAMAKRGARVLVLEREAKFRDRVRGEGMTPWGVVDARALGIDDIIMSASGHQLTRWQNYLGAMQVLDRPLLETPPHQPALSFYHPSMQHVLIDAAAAAGAEVRTGVRATGVEPGRPATVTVENGRAAERITARMVVGADGRGSLVRKWAGFSETQDPPRMQICGLYMEGCSAPEDSVRLVNDVSTAQASIIFALGGQRARTYFIHRVSDGFRLQGEKDVPQFIERCVATGMPAAFYERAEAAGPLATFDGADCYVQSPYRDGVALIGDAASSSDPSWGQGLSLTVRDARVLRDALVATDDWDAAGARYAAEHDRYYGTIHTVEDWFTQFFYETGPEADARRGRAFPLLAQDPTRMPDHFLAGPDAPAGERERRRFFGEE